MIFRSFIASLAILTTVLMAISAMVNYFSTFFHSIQNFTWLSLAFFFILTVITGYIGIHALGKSAHGFVASVNGIVLLKLMLSVGFLIAYLVITKPASPYFIIPFFVFYIIYTVFEIRQLIIAQKRNRKQQKVS
jgi:hypothetical protein